MCVTNIYVDRYPDGRRVEFRQTSICQYGAPGRPCAHFSTKMAPIRNIQYNEPSTQYILTSPNFSSVTPRSSGGSFHRRSGEYSRSMEYSPAPEDGHRHRSPKLAVPKATRTHKKKERIMIVEAPPTPRTPPQVFSHVYTAPNSPLTPPRVMDERRSRPIIVDERQIRDRQSRRRRSNSPAQRFSSSWDSPNSSHTSFDLRATERERQTAKQEAERRRDQRKQDEHMRALDDEIRRRPAVPVVVNQKSTYLKPIIKQAPAGTSSTLPLRDMMEGLRLDGAADGRRGENRGRSMRQQFADEEEEEQQAMNRRLRERQLPGRRSTVGPGHRRTRIMYDDGVYRFE